MDKLIAGDLVRLKSGGPVMTVVEIADFGLGDEQAKCQWFDKKDELKQDLFSLNVLVRHVKEKMIF